MVCKESAVPFRHWIINDAVEPLSYDDIPPLDGDGWEVHYDNELERGKQTLRKVSDQLKHVLDSIRGKMIDWRLRVGADLKDDPTMHGGGIHVMRAGGWLQTHLDYAKHPKLQSMERRLNLIAFLHPEWKDEWKGQLLLSDPLGKPIVEVMPKPGRVVAFETSDVSYHGVRQLSASAKPRITGAVYLLAERRDSATRERALFMPNRNNGGCPHEVM